MITQQQAEQLARAWIDAFNRHDLEAVLAHYADDVEHTSPVVVELLNDPSGTVRGKQALRSYFEKGLAANPDLRFELLQVLTGVDSVTVYYRGARGLCAEVMVLNPQGQIARVLVHYGAALRES